MYHHDGRDYEVAASEAAARGRVKMEEIIHKGQADAAAVLEGIQSRVITDKVVRASHAQLVFNDDGERGLYLADGTRPVHDHAMGQLLDNVGVPKKFADHLAAEAGGEMWGKLLLAENVNKILSYRAKQRNLVRIEGEADGGTVKGWLSDKFRRLDSRPLVDAFVGACQTLGLVPIDGVMSDTKCRVRAVMPLVFEPVPNEIMIFGAEFGNSDYGDGGMVVNATVTRVWCTNLAVTEKCLRQVHLGRVLPDDIAFSDETYRADARATALAVADVTRSVVGPERVHRMLQAIRSAGEKEIKSMDGIDKLLGTALDKGERDRVKAIFEGPDVVNVPPGNTVYRLSNAVSWLAQGASFSADRKIELQQVAGNLLAHGTAAGRDGKVLEA